MLERVAKPLQYVTTWKAKPLEELTRAELADALVEAWQYQQGRIDEKAERVDSLQSDKQRLQGKIDNLQDKLDVLQSDFDAYKATHP